MTDEEFFRAWRAWDAKPDKKRSHAMEDACIEKAQEIGLATTAFRRLLADWCSAGHTREQSLLAVQAGMLARSD